MNPSAMGAAVRAPTVAAVPVVMGFFDKKEEAPKKVAKKPFGRKVVKKTVPPASRPPGSSSAATQRLHGRPASPPTVPCEAAHGALCTAQVKKVVKKSVKKGSGVSQGDFKTNSGPLGTAKAFFSFGNKEEADNIATQDNWAFQAFNTLKDLPSSKGRRYGD